MMPKEITVSAELFRKILTFFYRDFEDYTGCNIGGYVGDASIHEIIDGLAEEFPIDRLDSLYPNEFTE